jgi:hypothetical protein
MSLATIYGNFPAPVNNITAHDAPKRNMMALQSLSVTYICNERLTLAHNFGSFQSKLEYEAIRSH